MAGSADLVVAAYDAEGAIDIEGTKLAKRILDNLVTTNDYTVGYSDKPTLPAIADELRYMTLLRGMVAAELVLDKAFVPSELPLSDPISLEWRDATPGGLRSIQQPASS